MSMASMVGGTKPSTVVFSKSQLPRPTPPTGETPHRPRPPTAPARQVTAFRDPLPEGRDDSVFRPSTAREDWNAAERCPLSLLEPLAVTLPDISSRTHTYASLAGVAQTGAVAGGGAPAGNPARTGWIASANNSATGSHITITFVPCLYDSDRKEYVGEAQAGIPHGHGVMRYKDGSVYTGAWVGGKRHGHGKMTWAKTGEVYDGHWDSERRHGQGTMTYADGGRYSGKWEDDQRHGYGHYTPADPSIRPSIGRWDRDTFSAIAQHVKPDYAPLTVREYKARVRAVRQVQKQLDREAERSRRIRDIVNGVEKPKRRRKKKKKRAW